MDKIQIILRFHEHSGGIELTGWGMFWLFVLAAYATSSDKK